jgi:phosphopantothenoylcysteine decarboxylase/phosphopantothenate--cysteine ligase
VSLKGKKILLGITGGIAAYKAAFLLREIQKSGAEVRAVMTPSALRFIGKDTITALTRQPVPVDVFPDDADISDSWTRHIHWGEWADALLIAPCTANTLAKIVHGFADNMLSSTVLAARCPVILCPTMDGGMYHSPAVKKNRDEALAHGFHIIEPAHGYLASGLHDTGRLPEPEIILQKLEEILDSTNINHFLANKHVVVTAGPTREHIDPVRFISNPSTGKMGIAMAEAALKAGAKVTLLYGPVSIPLPQKATCIPFVSADDLFNEVKKVQTADVIIMTAAVSDFTPKVRHQHKVKKTDADATLEFMRTPDILEWLGNHKTDSQTIIGFAMETENLIENAQNKLHKKKADWIIANTLNEPAAGFGTDTNAIYIIGQKQSEPIRLSGTKTEVAWNSLKTIFEERF